MKLYSRITQKKDSHPTAAPHVLFTSPQVDDLETFIGMVRKRTPAGVPLFVGGQSMGGLVAAHAALPPGHKLSGLVLTSALVDVAWTPMLRCSPPTFPSRFMHAFKTFP